MVGVGVALHLQKRGRSTVLVDPNLADNPNCPNPSTYYQNQPLNKYAQLWHTAGIGGKAYSFGFDDNCSQSSFKLIFNPTKLTITLLGNRPVGARLPAPEVGLE